MRTESVGFHKTRLETHKAEDGDEDVTSNIYLHAVFYPESSLKLAMTFWRLTGLGVSSRMAEKCLEGLANIRQATDLKSARLLYRQDWSPAHNIIRQRIVKLLRRSPIEPNRLTHLDSNDVYLYKSGMATIYHVQHALLSWRGNQSIVFGFTYELTPKLLETYGPSVRFYGFGTDDELADLESYLEVHSEDENKVQALWCECPSNPLLRTPNLGRLRALANKYHFPVIIDDTIGSFANVDVMNVADILITSLTKSFSGFADVMGGR